MICSHITKDTKTLKTYACQISKVDFKYERDLNSSKIPSSIIFNATCFPLFILAKFDSNSTPLASFRLMKVGEKDDESNDNDDVKDRTIAAGIIKKPTMYHHFVRLKDDRGNILTT